jgi:hypothetical protein
LVSSFPPSSHAQEIGGNATMALSFAKAKNVPDAGKYCLELFTCLFSRKIEQEK